MAYVGNQNYAVGDIVFVKKVAKHCLGMCCDRYEVCGTLRALGSFGTILEIELFFTSEPEYLVKFSNHMELWFLADQLQVLL